MHDRTCLVSTHITGQRTTPGISSPPLSMCSETGSLTVAHHCAHQRLGIQAPPPISPLEHWLTDTLPVLHCTRALGTWTQVSIRTQHMFFLTEPFPQCSSDELCRCFLPHLPSLIPSCSSSYSFLLLSVLPSHLPFHRFLCLGFSTFNSLGHSALSYLHHLGI